MNEQSFYHAIDIDEKKCNGRMKCIFSCPTNAIRVKNNKAKIIKELCIDCGECINVCPEKAFIPLNDEIKDLSSFKYLIAIPSPVLYTQFGSDIHPGLIHQAIKNIGFDEVYDSNRVSDEVGVALIEHIKREKINHPLIISYCPSIVRLILVNYPNLIDMISPFDVPREIIAKDIKKTYPEKLSLKPEEIGIIYITPCPSKIVSIKQPVEKESSWIDSAIPINIIYNLILPEILMMKKNNIQNKYPDFNYGRGWIALRHIYSQYGREKCLSVSGLRHVKMIFDDIENSKLRNISFIEAHACIQECLGGTFCVENPYIARHNSIIFYKKYSFKENFNMEEIIKKYKANYYFIEEKLEPRQTRKSKIDIKTSIKKMIQKERIYNKLPKKDCGLCGCPSCEIFAEDCSYGDAELTDCIFFK